MTSCRPILPVIISHETNWLDSTQSLTITYEHNQDYYMKLHSLRTAELWILLPSSFKFNNSLCLTPASKLF